MSRSDTPPLRLPTVGGRADRLLAAGAWGGALAVSGVFGWVTFDLVAAGARHLSLPYFLDVPVDAGRGGGITSLIVSTLWIVGVAIAVALPLALGAAIFLVELAPRGSRGERWVGRSLDVLAGVPSIVFGLFGNAFFSKLLGLGFSILSGGLTLACMALPLMVRSIEQGLRRVPESYRFAAAGLGLSRTGTLLRVLLPTARRGIGVGLILGIGRSLAETAALIFTSGYVTRMPTSVFDSGRALSVHVYDLSMNVPGGTERAATAALVLLVLLFAVGSGASRLSRHLLARGIADA